MKRERSLVLGVAAALGLAGCSSIPSVGPDYQEIEIKDPGFALPDAGMPTTNLTATFEYEVASSNADTRVSINNDTIARWWTRFKDPVLDSIIEGGISNNLGYLMAQKRLEQSAWNLLGSYANHLPKFGVGAGWSRYWYSKSTRSGNTTYNLRNAALDGNWEIDIFGGNRRLCEASLAQAQAAGWTVADAWVSLTTQIGEAYIGLRTIQERIDVARENLKLQSETYDILKSRLTSGIGDELAVNQCAYVVEETRARIPQLLAQEQQIKNQLAIYAGEMPGSLDTYLQPLPERRDWLLSPARLEALKLDMIRSRPDVKASERQLAAETARIGVAKAQWFPKLYVKGTVGWENKKSTPLFSREAFLASLGPAISWPIFQGGAIYANVKATEAKVDEAALAYEHAIQVAYGEVRDAYVSYTQEYHRNKALDGARKAAKDAVTISKDLYKNGLRDFNNVLDAQRSQLQFEEEFVLSRGQISVDLIDLFRALGGGVTAEIAKK